MKNHIKTNRAFHLMGVAGKIDVLVINKKKEATLKSIIQSLESNGVIYDKLVCSFCRGNMLWKNKSYSVSNKK